MSLVQDPSHVVTADASVLIPADASLVAPAEAREDAPVATTDGAFAVEVVDEPLSATGVRPPPDTADVTRDDPPTVRRPRDRFWAAVREVTLVAVLFVAYKFGRLAADGHVTTAMDNAWWVWDLERAVWLPNEVSVQKLIIENRSVIYAANSYYASLHFPATAACLIWMYLCRPAVYLWTRRVLAYLTAAALVLHVLTPLAPPRMLTVTGMIDTAQVYGPAVYGDSPDTDRLANQYAAMPSLHVGWAVVVAIALIMATRSRWRWCWLLHPIITQGVVVATGNHYWLDSIVALLLLGMVLLIRPWRMSLRWFPRRWPTTAARRPLKTPAEDTG